MKRVLMGGAVATLLSAGGGIACRDDYEQIDADAAVAPEDAGVPRISEAHVRGYLAAINTGWMQLVDTAQPRLRDDQGRRLLGYSRPTFELAERRQSFLGAAEPSQYSAALAAAFAEALTTARGAPLETIDLQVADAQVKLLRTTRDELSTVMIPSALDPDLSAEASRMGGELSSLLQQVLALRDRLRESGVRVDAGYPENRDAGPEIDGGYDASVWVDPGSDAGPDDAGP